MRKWFLVFLLVCLPVLLFASGSKEAGTKEASITVRMGSWWKDALPGIVEKFQADHPNIKIVTENIPYVGYLDKAVASAVGPQPPDVLAITSEMMPALGGKGLLVDVGDMVKKSKIIKEENYFPGAWQLGFYKGTHYALAYRFSTFAFYYNQGHYEEVGLDPNKPPATYEEVLEYSKKLTIPGKRYGIGLPAAAKNPGHFTANLVLLIWKFGGDYLNKEWTKSVINQPNAVKGVQFWTDYYTKHKVAPEASLNYDGNDLGRVFGAGTVSQYFAGLWGRGNIKETATPDLKYEVSKVPPDKVATGGTWAWTIPKNSDQKEAAWTFMEWFLDAERLPEVMIRPPSSLSSIGHPKWSTPEGLPFLETAKYSRALPSLAVWPEIQKAIVDEAQAVLLGKKQVQPAMDEAAKKIDALLK
jgi:multiple sugar transport system substrate-binding protein